MKYFKTLFLIAIVSVLSTVTAHADLGDQLFKLLAEDGASYDYFGNAIAIDNGIVAVGAVGDDENGYLSGSAYLFNASTGTQIGIESLSAERTGEVE